MSNDNQKAPSQKRFSWAPRYLRWIPEAIVSEKVGSAAAAIAVIALVLQWGDFQANRDRDADVRTSTEAATRTWFDSNAGWTLWVTIQDIGDNVMAPDRLEITPVIYFKNGDSHPHLGKPLEVEVTEFEAAQGNERFRVVVPNVQRRVCSSISGNADLCEQGDIQRFIVTVRYGQNESFRKRAYEGRS